MKIEINGLETGVTMITLFYNEKTYTTGCFFADEVGEKIQLLINSALESEIKNQ